MKILFKNLQRILTVGGDFAASFNDLELRISKWSRNFTKGRKMQKTGENRQPNHGINNLRHTAIAESNSAESLARC
jgi:hypothetical protein